MSNLNNADPAVVEWLEAQPTAEADDDNPEWTAEDLARARSLDSVPAGLLTPAERAHRGAGRKPRKRLQSIRLDPDVVDYFRSTGDRWQSRINAVLREAMEAGK